MDSARAFDIGNKILAALKLTGVSLAEVINPGEYEDFIVAACDALEKQQKLSCATCKYGRAEGRLYGCRSTEMNIESNQTPDFYCSKWEEEK